MTKAQTAAARRSAWWSPGWSWKVWIMVALLLIPTFGFAVWVLAEAGGQSKIDPQLVAIAGQNSGGPVTAITGTEHTVYHSNQPLPTAENPRSDGRFTLVWFTSTTCAQCEDQLFAHRVMVEFEDVMFAEKDVSREPAAARFGVSRVPTFIWLDAQGKELGRFTEVADEAALRAEVQRVRAEAP